MASTIATKADLQLLRQEVKGDISDLRHELRQEMALVRKDVELLSERIDMVTTNVTVRLGAIMAGLTGLLFAALKLT